MRHRHFPPSFLFSIETLSSSFFFSFEKEEYEESFSLSFSGTLVRLDCPFPQLFATVFREY